MLRLTRWRSLFALEPRRLRNNLILFYKFMRSIDLAVEGLAGIIDKEKSLAVPERIMVVQPKYYPGYIYCITI